MDETHLAPEDVALLLEELLTDEEAEPVWEHLDAPGVRPRAGDSSLGQAKPAIERFVRTP